MGPFCSAIGGEFFVDLQDENYVIRFGDKRFRNEEMQKVMRQAVQLPGPPLIWVGYTGQIGSI